jgi:ribosomal protein S27AE
MAHGDARLPLARHANSAPDAKVRLICQLCGSGHEVEAALVIWLLKAFGLGDELSPVADAAKVAFNRCIRCGATAWLAQAVERAAPRRSA